MNIGDFIGIRTTRNTHDCQDKVIAKLTAPHLATVVWVQSCTSAWYEGHDSYHRFFSLGGELWVSSSAFRTAGEGWPESVAWEANSRDIF